MKQISDKIIAKINAEIAISCIDDSDTSSDKALYMINFIRPLFEELREFIHQYTFCIKQLFYLKGFTLTVTFSVLLAWL